jgi:stress response protein YsnF
MACMRDEFDKWYESAPEDLESDRPSEDVLKKHEEEVKAHKELVRTIAIAHLI